MSYDIGTQTLDAQPVLVTRKKAAPGPGISQAIGEGLGTVFAYVHRNGIAVAGPPLARYPEVTPEFMRIEPGVAVAGPVEGSGVGGEEVHADELPGGLTAHTMHLGPYDKLHEAYAALEKWIEAQGLTPRDAPWELYLTDPGEVEDPAEWKTEIFWPVQ